MNKLIEELKNKTLDKHFYYTWSTMDYDDVTKFAEKFAELIVIECAKIASDSVIDHSGHSETNICPKYLGYKIKDHFGVEE